MELDEFKELYNSSTNQPVLTDQNITSMITRKSQGPLAELQKRIKFILCLLLSLIVFCAGLFIAVLGAGEVAHNLILWLLFLIMFSECVVSLLNYFTIKKMQKSTGNVKENLLTKVNLLKRRYKWYFIVYIVLFLMMPLLMELGVRYQAIGMFHGLGKINVFIRLAWYCIVFIPLFVIKKEAQKQNYGRYLDQLNGLLEQTR